MVVLEPRSTGVQLGTTTWQCSRAAARVGPAAAVVAMRHRFALNGDSEGLLTTNPAQERRSDELCCHGRALARVYWPQCGVTARLLRAVESGITTVVPALSLETFDSCCRLLNHA